MLPPSCLISFRDLIPWGYMGTAAKPTRENRTIIVDFQNETIYFQLLGNGKAFLDRLGFFIFCD